MNWYSNVNRQVQYYWKIGCKTQFVSYFPAFSSNWSALHFLRSVPWLPTLSYTFLRRGMLLKPAPGQTFLHFPTVPTPPDISYASNTLHRPDFCLDLPETYFRTRHTISAPSSYQGRTILAPCLHQPCTILTQSPLRLRLCIPLYMR